MQSTLQTIFLDKTSIVSNYKVLSEDRDIKVRGGQGLDF